MRPVKRIGPLVLVAALGFMLFSVGSDGIGAVRGVAAAPTLEFQSDCGESAAGLDSEQAMGPNGGPCQGCPRKTNQGQCTRISCEPCCYACLGEPLPVCLN